MGPCDWYCDCDCDCDCQAVPKMSAPLAACRPPILTEEEEAASCSAADMETAAFEPEE